jgi:membrane protein YqaA with SNARE-associated domain
MRLFEPLYRRCIVLAGHRHAPIYLAGVSASESVIFPIPPDVMLAPMALAQPTRWWRFALICTLASVLGGLLGYLLGQFALDWVWPWIERFGQVEVYHRVQALFVSYGFWIVFAAGFTPIPYKIFTIASGAAGIGLIPFTLGSLVGRGTRYLLVAGVAARLGPRFEKVFLPYIERIGWAVVVLLVLAIALLELRG